MISTKQKKVIFIIIISLVLLIVRWNSFTTPFERDEGEYAYSAWIMRQGIMPYENSFLQKPPMIIYTYMFSQLLFGHNLWGPRLFAFVFIIFSSLLIYQISLIQFNKSAALISSALFLFLVSSPFNASLAANTEVFMLLPMLAVFFVFVKKGTGLKITDIIMISFSAVTAILYKPICVYLLIFLFTSWAINIYKRHGISRLIYFVTVSVLSSVATLFVWISPFLITGSVGGLWEQAVVFNSMYVKYWGWGFGNFIHNLSFIWPSFWPIYFLVIAFFVFTNKHKHIYLGLILTSIFAVYQTSIRHYYLILMPFLSITASYALVKISNLMIVRKTLKSFSLLTPTLFVVFIFIWPVKNQFALTPEQLSIYIYGTVNPFTESKIISDEVVKITGKNDCIYVAGSEPQIYFYAQRVSCTKFNISYPINLDTPSRDLYQKQIKAELETNPPKVIVVSNREESGFWDEKAPQYFIDYFKNLLNDYRLVGGYIWDGGKGYYTQNISPEEINNASLIVYKYAK